MTIEIFVVTSGMGSNYDSAWKTQAEADKRANHLNSQQSGFGNTWEVQSVPLHN